ncbi:hypothetical protein ABVT39_010428 [Epinephelus coioides]
MRTPDMDTRIASITGDTALIGIIQGGDTEALPTEPAGPSTSHTAETQASPACTQEPGELEEHEPMTLHSICNNFGPELVQSNKNQVNIRPKYGTHASPKNYILISSGPDVVQICIKTVFSFENEGHSFQGSSSALLFLTRSEKSSLMLIEVFFRVNQLEFSGEQFLHFRLSFRPGFISFVRSKSINHKIIPSTLILEVGILFYMSVLLVPPECNEIWYASGGTAVTSSRYTNKVPAFRFAMVSFSRGKQTWKSSKVSRNELKQRYSHRRVHET